MNHAIAKQWVAALRSGQYKQTTGALRNGDSFCCLGVLCNLHAIAHPKIARKEVSTAIYLGMGGALPYEVRTWAGMFTKTRRIPDLNETLASLNDDGSTFDEIAAVIEKNVKQL